MLVVAIRGENFMKFGHIALEDIPTRGVIGVEGRNEGGKSTVGELLQFAFFGKTTSTRDTSVLDLIRWDQDQCAVEVDFEVEGEGRLRVWREVDRYGTNYARLLKIDAGAGSSMSRFATGNTGAAGTEIASGTMQVHRALDRMLRFSYDDFINSFYLEEQDFPRSPEQMREYLDRIAGVEVVLRATDEVDREIVGLEEEFSNLQSSIKRNTLQIEKYLPNVARIPESEKARDLHAKNVEDLRGEERDIKGRMDSSEQKIKERESQRDRLRSLKGQAPAKFANAVENVLRAYPEEATGALSGSKRELRKVRDRLLQVQELGGKRDAVVGAAANGIQKLDQRLNGRDAGSIPTREAEADAELSKAEAKRARARLWATVLLGVAVVAGLFTADQAMGWTGESPLGIAAEQRNLALGVGGGVAALGLIGSLVLFSRIGGCRRRAEQAQKAKRDLATERSRVEKQLAPLRAINAEIPLDELPDRAAAAEDPEVTSTLEAFRSQRESALAGAGSLDKLFGSLADEENKIVQRLRATTKGDQKELQKAAESQKREQSKRDRAESEIREYQKQDGKRLALEEQNKELREKADALRAQIETRQLLKQLYQETVESVRQRTGPALGRAMRRLVPHLTGGRYTDLKVTPDFRLQIFTSDKSDFLTPQELSGGTFEGLSFGFRLAFSQAFIRAVVQHAQFLFLDEPFKAMDRDRVHRALAVLSKLSEDMPQLFVVLPGIAEEDRQLFDAIITAEVGQGVLTFSGVEVPGQSASKEQPSVDRKPEPAKPTPAAIVEPASPSRPEPQGTESPDVVLFEPTHEAALEKQPDQKVEDSRTRRTEGPPAGNPLEDDPLDDWLGLATSSPPDPPEAEEA